MKILLLSRYDRLGASTRLRTLQFIPYLESQGFQIDIKPLFSNSYLEAFNSGKSRIGKAVKGYFKRVRVLINLKQYDLIWLEKELFSYLPAIGERILSCFKIPYVVDYDDAIFHRYDCHKFFPIRFFLGKKIDVVMRKASAVIAGNRYLAERAESAGAPRVEIIPTVIDIERYSLKTDYSKEVTIVWIGSRTTTPYFANIVPIIQKGIEEKRLSKENIKIVAVGAYEKMLEGLPVKIIPWKEEEEVFEIKKFDIGIMPLPDNKWERGKCGYKLIQYMACGLPVVASPVGINKEIIADGINGYLATTPEEWITAISNLAGDENLRKEMGLRGREFVEKNYTLQIQSPKLAAIFKDIIGKQKN